MQNYNIFMTILQLVLAFHLMIKLSLIRYMTECTLSELNRMTDRIHEAGRTTVQKMVLALVVMVVVWVVDHPIANAFQVLLCLVSIWWWFSAMKEQMEFELILLKRKVERIGKSRAVSRLHKQAA